MPEKRGGHIHVRCPQCGAKPAAKFTDVPLENGETEVRVSYIRDGARKSPTPRMVVVTVRMPEQIAAQVNAKGGEWKRDCLTEAINRV
jgi:hypothetical protein